MSSFLASECQNSWSVMHIHQYPQNRVQKNTFKKKAQPIEFLGFIGLLSLLCKFWTSIARCYQSR